MMTYCDIVYARTYEQTLLLDLYLPERVTEPVPVVIWIHGGAWNAGSKADPEALPLVDRGYAVASIQYRLTDQAIFPAQIHDCKAAARWLRANADTYHLDPARIGVWGGSAGAYLAALMGTSGGVASLEGDLGNPGYSSRVQAVCDGSGPTDFLKMNDAPTTVDHDAPDSPTSILIGGPVQENVDAATRASPITYVTPDNPPFLIMHGELDPIIPVNQAELLYEALQAAGVDSTLIVVEGMGHGFGPQGCPADLALLQWEFFDRHLKGESDRRH